jgi:tetratricopeptide (TPR) repeat protein
LRPVSAIWGGGRKRWSKPRKRSASIANWRGNAPTPLCRISPGPSATWPRCSGIWGGGEDALEQAEEAVHLCRELAVQRPDAFLPNLATSLNNLANRLSDLGRREDALEQAEEAVRLYRELAGRRLDAFGPDLARSFAVRGSIITDDRPGEAMASFAEAIQILTPFFTALPQAHLGLMRGSREERKWIKFTWFCSAYW